MFRSRRKTSITASATSSPLYPNSDATARTVARRSFPRSAPPAGSLQRPASERQRRWRRRKRARAAAPGRAGAGRAGAPQGFLPQHLRAEPALSRAPTQAHELGTGGAGEGGQGRSRLALCGRGVGGKREGAGPVGVCLDVGVVGSDKVELRLGRPPDHGPAFPATQHAGRHRERSRNVTARPCNTCGAPRLANRTAVSPKRVIQVKPYGLELEAPVRGIDLGLL